MNAAPPIHFDQSSKKVWLAFKDLLDRPENDDIQQQLIEKLEQDEENEPFQ